MIIHLIEQEFPEQKHIIVIEYPFYSPDLPVFWMFFNLKKNLCYHRLHFKDGTEEV